MIRIYTDGAARPNPGKSGYGLIVESEKLIKIQQGFELSTNNRMELLAVVEGLELTNKNADKDVEVYSDSKYVTDAVNEGWLKKWESNNWKRKGVFIPNLDLWHRFAREIRYRNVSFIWVRGHNGHPQNEECDKMAGAAISGRLCVDQNFIDQDI